MMMKGKKADSSIYSKRLVEIIKTRTAGGRIACCWNLFVVAFCILYWPNLGIFPVGIASPLRREKPASAKTRYPTQLMPKIVGIFTLLFWGHKFSPRWGHEHGPQLVFSFVHSDLTSACRLVRSLWSDLRGWLGVKMTDVSILGFPGAYDCGFYCCRNIFVVLARDSIRVHMALSAYVSLCESFFVH